MKRLPRQCLLLALVVGCKEHVPLVRLTNDAIVHRDDGQDGARDLWAPPDFPSIPDGAVAIPVPAMHAFGGYPGLVCAAGREMLACKQTDATSWRQVGRARDLERVDFHGVWIDASGEVSAVGIDDTGASRAVSGSVGSRDSLQTLFVDPAVQLMALHGHPMPSVAFAVGSSNAAGFAQPAVYRYEAIWRRIDNLPSIPGRLRGCFSLADSFTEAALFVGAGGLALHWQTDLPVATVENTMTTRDFLAAWAPPGGPFVVVGDGVIAQRSFDGLWVADHGWSTKLVAVHGESANDYYVLGERSLYHNSSGRFEQLTPSGLAGARLAALWVEKRGERRIILIAGENLLAHCEHLPWNQFVECRMERVYEDGT